MSISSFYDNKKILITGVTGFVGKVLLEKFLWSLPNTDKFFLLIRNKKGSSLTERFKKEIFESPCFDRLRAVHKENFESWFFEKVHPISGDLLKDRLALSENDENYIIENIDVIINSAASVDFNARIDEAINTNTIGTLRVYSLAKRCKKIVNFLHVSTAYVNSDKRGWIDEEVYPMDIDPELLLKNLLSMPVDELVKQTQTILGKYPNTYTFTKALTERIINKEKGKYTVTILRPTIIGCSFKEPFLGWVDTVSAAGALYLLGGVGLLKYAQGNKENIGDQVPVDYVVNGIILSAAYYSNSRTLNIVHSGTSEKNPVTWDYSTVVVTRFWRQFRSEKSISLPSFELISSPLRLELQLLKTEIPAYIYSVIANKFGSAQMKKNANKLTKMLGRSRNIGDIFKHFTCNEWIFSTKNLSIIEKSLSEEDRMKFDLDVTKIEWTEYLLHFAWGLKKFVLKENCDPPNNVKRLDLLSKKNNLNGYFTDMQWAMNHGKVFQPSSAKTLINKVLSTQRVRKLIELEGKGADQRANEICQTMFAEYNMKTLRFFAWSLHKAFQRLYEKIVIDENQIKFLKELEMKGPLVLAPNHVSYVDFLVISYIFYQYGLKCPHVNSHEDFLSIKFVTKLLRASGAFFIRKKAKTYDNLYRAIITEYLNSLLEESCNLEIFIEISRSRSGKLTSPSNEVFDIFIKSYLNNEITTKNLHIVPISINFERVIEGETFPYELLGETKVKESFSRLISSINILKNNFGRIFVEFCDPISLSSYTNSTEPIESRVSTIKSTILNELNDKSVVMPTSILASILLMHRKGGVTEDHLIKRTEWLANELLKRNKKIGSLSDTSTHIPVRNAIKLLENIIVRKKDMFGLSVTPKVDYKNVLLLSYYRNALLNTFANEAIMVCALAAFGQQIAWKEGADVKRLIEENNFLCNLLEKEFIFNINANDTLEKMIKFNILKIEDQKIKVTNDLMVSFLCSLIWPFVESYWVSVVYLFSLKNKDGYGLRKLVQQIQWFAESMHEERIVESYESCSQDSIKKAIQTYRTMGIIQKDPKSKNYHLSTSEEQLQDLENHVNKFLKNAFAKSVDSPIDIARKSMLVDFPFMAKL